MHCTVECAEHMWYYCNLWSMLISVKCSEGEYYCFHIMKEMRQAVLSLSCALEHTAIKCSCISQCLTINHSCLCRHYVFVSIPASLEL